MTKELVWFRRTVAFIGSTMTPYRTPFRWADGGNHHELGNRIASYQDIPPFFKGVGQDTFRCTCLSMDIYCLLVATGLTLYI
jgi:hypothetical protein